MAITSSAKKAIRTSARKHIFNLRRIGALKDATKEFMKALAAKDAAQAENLLKVAYKAIDKAKERGIIKTNTAARKKSRLALALKRTRA